MIFRVQEEISTHNLVKIGSKRKWVPMWLWLHVIFRCGLYEIWPFSVLTYKRA